MERAGWGRAHLVTASIAIGLAAAIMFAGRAVAIHRERSSVSSLAPELLQLKNQGLVIQRVAAEARDVLPIYGSSELTFGSAAERGSNFFRTEPTGFQVSPVGKAGATPLVIVQKLGALGSTLRGKKLAISLSPEWFLLPEIGRFWYEGNFSPAAANEMIFGNALNFELKREIAPEATGRDLIDALHAAIVGRLVPGLAGRPFARRCCLLGNEYKNDRHQAKGHACNRHGDHHDGQRTGSHRRDERDRNRYFRPSLKVSR